jgi:type IV pilus biogenesis protein CpaD/CtpE
MRIRTPFLLVLLLAGCASSEQFEHPGTWKLPPSGQDSNAANLRAMVVNPHDLVAGTDAPGSLGAEAARPVGLLLKGQRTPLINASASAVGQSSAAAAAPAAAGGAGGS